MKYCSVIHCTIPPEELKLEVCHDANFVGHLVALAVVVTKTSGATCDDKVSIMTTLNFQRTTTRQCSAINTLKSE